MSADPKAVVSIDTFTSTPEFAFLREALGAGSWPTLEAALSTLPDDQAGVALTQLAAVEGIEDLLREAVQSDSRTTFARTALAARYTVLAWEARSRNVAKGVSAEQFQGFFEWLAMAEDLLLSVFEDDPKFAPAWFASLTTARGLQLGKEELHRRYSQLSTLSPDNFPAQEQALIFLLPKWFGSWEESREFVDEAVRSAPTGSSSHAIVPLFHIERWSDAGLRESLAQLGDPNVLAELRQASESFVVQGVPLDPVRVEAHSAFGMMFWLGQHWDDAAVHFRMLDWRASEFPWRYVTDSESKLSRIYQKVLKKAKN